MRGYINGAADMLPYVKAAFSGIAPEAFKYFSRNIQHTSGGEVEAYANGTDCSANAFIAGDGGGPELIMNARGSKVFTAQETQYIIHALPMLNSMAKAYQTYQASRVMEPLSVQPSVNYGGRAINISLAPVYNLPDTANKAEMQPILDRNNESLKQLILDTVHEAGIDNIRRELE
jgi:hypothetical protein